MNCSAALQCPEGKLECTQAEQFASQLKNDLEMSSMANEIERYSK